MILMIFQLKIKNVNYYIIYYIMDNLLKTNFKKVQLVLTKNMSKILSNDTMRIVLYMCIFVSLFLISKFYDSIIPMLKNEVTMDDLVNKLKSINLISFLNTYGVIILILIITMINLKMSKISMTNFSILSIISLLIISLLNYWDVTAESTIYYDTNNLNNINAKSIIRYILSLLMLIGIIYSSGESNSLSGFLMLMIIVFVCIVHIKSDITRFSFWPFELFSLNFLSPVNKIPLLIKLIYTIPYTDMKIVS